MQQRHDVADTPKPSHIRACITISRADQNTNNYKVYDVIG